MLSRFSLPFEPAGCGLSSRLIKLNINTYLSYLGLLKGHFNRIMPDSVFITIQMCY